MNNIKNTGSTAILVSQIDEEDDDGIRVERCEKDWKLEPGQELHWSPDENLPNNIRSWLILERLDE